MLTRIAVSLNETLESVQEYHLVTTMFIGQPAYFNSIGINSELAKAMAYEAERPRKAMKNTCIYCDETRVDNRELKGRVYQLEQDIVNMASQQEIIMQKEVARAIASP